MGARDAWGEEDFEGRQWIYGGGGGMGVKKSIGGWLSRWQSKGRLRNIT